MLSYAVFKATLKWNTKLVYTDELNFEIFSIINVTTIGL